MRDALQGEDTVGSKARKRERERNRERKRKGKTQKFR